MNFDSIDPNEIRLLVRVATRRTGCPVHDEDLEQDVTLRAVEAFRKQFVVRYPRAFLAKIVRDAVRDHWRKRRPIGALDAVDERWISVAPRFEERLDFQRRLDLLRSGMARLDAQKRQTLDLFYVEELPVAKIARLQRRSVSAVKMELLRARRHLADIMRQLGENADRMRVQSSRSKELPNEER